MKRVYVITMWSGGRPAKKWKAYDAPNLLPSGTGVEFTDVETKLPVRVIGSISIEDFESGKEEIETGHQNRRGSGRLKPPPIDDLTVGPVIPDEPDD